MIYYKYLFRNMPELSASEGILYSELIYRSLLMDASFTESGKLNIEVVLEKLEDWGAIIECCRINISKLAEELETTRPAIRRGLESLKEKDILRGRYIRCSKELVKQKYLTLPSDTKLRGRQLVFLAYLINRGKPYGGTIDTWGYKMADACGISGTNVSSIICALHKRGFIERLEGGKIKIRKDLTTSPDKCQI